jgi:hypothetical protein
LESHGKLGTDPDLFRFDFMMTTIIAHLFLTPLKEAHLFLAKEPNRKNTLTRAGL